MPKIVPDIQKKIISTATRHFLENGFDKTDMREIAAEAEIAVGTIYLHYQNKETLFLHVIRHNWQQCGERIEEISNSDQRPEEQLRKILRFLIEEMLERKSQNSLWMEIGSLHHQKIGKFSETNHLSEIREPISQNLGKVIRKMVKNDPSRFTEQTCAQLGSFAFIMTVDACMQNPKEAADKLDLIIDLLNSYLN